MNDLLENKIRFLKTLSQEIPEEKATLIQNLQTIIDSIPPYYKPILDSKTTSTQVEMVSQELKKFGPVTEDKLVKLNRSMKKLFWKS